MIKLKKNQVSLSLFHSISFQVFHVRLSIATISRQFHSFSLSFSLSRFLSFAQSHFPFIHFSQKSTFITTPCVYIVESVIGLVFYIASRVHSRIHLFTAHTCMHMTPSRIFTDDKEEHQKAIATAHEMARREFIFNQLIRIYFPKWMFCISTDDKVPPMKAF